MTKDQFQRELQARDDKITSLENDPVMQKVMLDALTCSETKQDDLDKFYVNRMEVDVLNDEKQELAKAYYSTKNKKG